MGIRGMMTYLEQYCPNGYSDVFIGDVVLKYRYAYHPRMERGFRYESNEPKSKRTYGSQPELVVDGNACYSIWTRDLDWTVGLQVKEIRVRLERFVNVFAAIGFKLVFFFDGLTPRKKRQTWLDRRRKTMEKMVKVYNELCKGASFHQLAEELTYIPPSMTNFVSYFLKHVMNCKVIVAVHEADEEIVDYVVKNPNSLIFTDDTDFIVSYIHSDVLSAKHFHEETMTTRMYDRFELNKHLNLRADQLPYLAILAGNDVVNQEAVKPFHFRLTNWPSHKRNIPYNVLMENLAGYINYDLPGHVSSNNHMRIISSDLFGNRVLTPFLRMAHKAYIPNSRPLLQLDDTPWSQILIVAKKRMQNVMLPVSAWGILYAYIYESNPILEDYRRLNINSGNPNEWPCATVTRLLRQRWYGILLFEIQYVQRPVVEWCAENSQSYQHHQLVHPVYPPVYHPGLLALWQKRGRNIDNHKWALFLYAVSPNISDFEGWKSLREDLVVSTAVIRYLYDAEVLTTDEVRALLVTTVMFEHFDADDIMKRYNGLPDSRATQISVMFSRTFSIMFSIFATCGYPVPLSCNNAHIKFEPLLFQRIFEEVHARTILGILCLGQEDAKSVFHEMKYLVYKT